MDDSLAARIKFARQQRGFTQSDVADEFGINRVSVAQWESGDTRPDQAKISSLAALLNTNSDWLLGGMGDPPPKIEAKKSPKRRKDIPPNASAPVPTPDVPERLIPVYGVAVGGSDGRMKFNGELVDMVGCPPELRNIPNAYAIYVSGDSMVPSFKPGQIAWINPNLAARIGDDVVVQLRPDGDGETPEGFIKELVKRTPNRLIVKQYNPECDIEFENHEVLTVHVVVFASRR